jgi:phenylalanyl-tRNA synthetase alpha chain
MNDLQTVVAAARAAFELSPTPADLENTKAQYLGKAGQITDMMKGLAALSVDEKKTRGAAINLAKQAIEAALDRATASAGRCRPAGATARRGA